MVDFSVTSIRRIFRSPQAQGVGKKKFKSGKEIEITEITPAGNIDIKNLTSQELAKAIYERLQKELNVVIEDRIIKDDEYFTLKTSPWPIKFQKEGEFDRVKKIINKVITEFQKA